MPKYRVLLAESRYPDHAEEKAVFDRIDAEMIVETSDDEDKIAALCIGPVEHRRHDIIRKKLQDR